MKKLIRPIIILAVGLAVAISSAACTYPLSRQASPVNTTGVAYFFQTTATPQPQEDKSEIGSTDGIAAMGFIIVLIVIVPILLRRQGWSNGKQKK